MELVVHTPAGKPIRAYVARPAARGPGIVVLHSSWGLFDDYKEICDQLGRSRAVQLGEAIHDAVVTFYGTPYPDSVHCRHHRVDQGALS